MPCITFGRSKRPDSQGLQGARLREATVSGSGALKRVPGNLISGPLGVGKTTTIRHLQANRTEGECWAALVNRQIG
jgi:DNA polymerase III delta prime subunit